MSETNVIGNAWRSIAIHPIPPNRPIEVQFVEFKSENGNTSHIFTSAEEIPQDVHIDAWRHATRPESFGETPEAKPVYIGADWARDPDRTVVHKVGDITSTAKGSGARYNEGKPDLSQIPLHLLAYSGDVIPAWLADMLNHVSDFQFKNGPDFTNLNAALKCIPDAYREAAHVFSYGEKKYAKYNWMKGMAWTVPLACIGRHALYIIEGEEIDPESGRLHAGHIACNIIMLLHYIENYLEGDDRPCLAQ